MKKIAPVLLAGWLLSCNDAPDKPVDNQTAGTETPVEKPAVLSYSIIKAFPHDTMSFTQGLTFYKGQLYEGTGLEGRSKLLKVNLETGKAERKLDLAPEFFGEGVAILHDTIYQLTWKNNVVFAYRVSDFRKINQFPIATDGWGITTDGTNLIVSDGSSNLYYYTPGDFKLEKKQVVTESGSPTFNLNELEYIKGFIYANQWQYNYILKIDPATGRVVGKADLTEINNRVKMKDPDAEFLNGIAYDDSTGRIYVTGKNWPELYEIQFSN